MRTRGAEMTVARLSSRAGRNENRNERWYLEQFREAHNRRPGSMAWRKHIRARHVRRRWRLMLNIWAVSVAPHAFRYREEST